MTDKKTSVLLQAAIDEVNSNKEIKKQMERLVKQFSGKYRLDCPVRLDTGPALRQAEQLVTQINRKMAGIDLSALSKPGALTITPEISPPKTTKPPASFIQSLAGEWGGAISSSLQDKAVDGITSSAVRELKNVGGTPKSVPLLHAPTAAGFLREPQVWTPQPV